MTTFDYIAGIIEDVTGVPAKEITPAARWNEIGVDSLDLVDVLQQIETDFAFEFPEFECEAVVTAGELVSLVEKHKTRTPG